MKEKAKHLGDILDQEKCFQLLEEVKNGNINEVAIVCNPTADNTLEWKGVSILTFTGGSGFDGKKNNAIAMLREMMKERHPNDVWTNKIIGARILFTCKDAVLNSKEIKTLQQR